MLTEISSKYLWGIENFFFIEYQDPENIRNKLEILETLFIYRKKMISEKEKRNNKKYSIMNILLSILSLIVSTVYMPPTFSQIQNISHTTATD